MVRAEAVRLIPTAALGLAPHDTTLVNIQTVMWVDAPRRQTLRPVTILGQRVLVRLTIDHVRWNFGDNVGRASHGAGKPYSQSSDPCHAAQCPGYYGHTYRASGTRRITATASWRASFTVDGGQATDIPGTIPGPAATTNIIVKQARAVLTPNPGGR